MHILNMLLKDFGRHLSVSVSYQLLNCFQWSSCIPCFQSWRILYV